MFAGKKPLEIHLNFGPNKIPLKYGCNDLKSHLSALRCVDLYTRGTVVGLPFCFFKNKLWNYLIRLFNYYYYYYLVIEFRKKRTCERDPHVVINFADYATRLHGTSHLRAKTLPSVIKLYWPAGPGLTKARNRRLLGWPAGNRMCGTGGEICIPGRRFVGPPERAFLFVTSNDDDELNSCSFGFLGTSNDDLNATHLLFVGTSNYFS